MTFQRPLFRLVRLYETSGSIICRHYDARGAGFAVIWLGGVGGGFDSPAHDLFDHLASDLVHRGISSLRIRYRLPGDLDQCVEDTLVGIEFLEQRGVKRVALIGHSFGGAIAIQAGAAAAPVSAVATLACQSYGTSGADRVSPRPLLLIHGSNDAVLPPECSAYIYERAREPKELVLLPGAGHCFDEVEPELREVLMKWIDRARTVGARSAA